MSSHRAAYKALRTHAGELAGQVHTHERKPETVRPALYTEYKRVYPTGGGLSRETCVVDAVAHFYTCLARLQEQADPPARPTPA